MSLPWHVRWWHAALGQSADQSLEPRPSVLLLACQDRYLMGELVAALQNICRDYPGPEVTGRSADASTARVAVFIYPTDPSGNPTPWEGRSGDIGYDAPASFRLLGFVSVDP